MARSDVLVSTEWAEQNLNADNTVFIEVDEDTSAYDGGHVPPGAIKLDWKQDLQDGIRRDFVDADRFSKLLSERGVSNDDTVILYGGNNNWFAAYAYWYFKLYGHNDVKLIDGGRKKWELDGRPLSSDPVTRPATDYKASSPDLSIRAFRDEVIDAIGTKNLVDVRSPDEFSGKILAPAHLPQEQAQQRGHVPRRDQHPVVDHRQRGRHLQVRRGPHRSVRGEGLRRQPRDHRLLPHRRAFEPHLVRAHRAAGQEERQELRRKLGRVRLAGRCADRTRRRKVTIMCAAPKQGQKLPAGVDVEKETVLTGQVTDARVTPSPAPSSVCSTRPASSPPRSSPRRPATSDSSPPPGTWTLRALSSVGNGDASISPRVPASTSRTSPSPSDALLVVGPRPHDAPGHRTRGDRVSSFPAPFRV